MPAPLPSPLHVVLPLEGDPLPLLAAVGSLVERWPADVDAVLVVPTGPLDARDRTLLAQLGDDVLRPVAPAGTPFGGLVARAAQDLPPDAALLVLDPADLPAPDALDLLASGRPAPGGLHVPGAALRDVPVLSAAGDLPSLAALLGTLEPLPVPLPAPARQVAPLSRPVPARAGSVSAVLRATGPLPACRPACPGSAAGRARPCRSWWSTTPATRPARRGWPGSAT